MWRTRGAEGQTVGGVLFHGIATAATAHASATKSAESSNDDDVVR